MASSASFFSILFAALTCVAMPVAAQQRAPTGPSAEVSDRCPGLVASSVPRLMPAAYKVAALADNQARVTYIGHSTFLIESPRLVRIATDYNDYVKPSVLPDIATMNHAHSTHFTDHPEPQIKHVLRGWGPSPDQPARHDIQFGDVRVVGHLPRRVVVMQHRRPAGQHPADRSGGR